MDSICTFLVGPPETRQAFEVNQLLAMGSSAVFRAAFAGDNWIESQTRTIELTDVDPEVFGMVVHWICNDENFPDFPASTTDRQ